MQSYRAIQGNFSEVLKLALPDPFVACFAGDSADGAHAVKVDVPRTITMKHPTRRFEEYKNGLGLNEHYTQGDLNAASFLQYFNMQSLFPNLGVRQTELDIYASGDMDLIEELPRRKSESAPSFSCCYIDDNERLSAFSLQCVRAAEDAAEDRFLLKVVILKDVDQSKEKREMFFIAHDDLLVKELPTSSRVLIQATSSNTLPEQVRIHLNSTSLYTLIQNCLVEGEATFQHMEKWNECKDLLIGSHPVNLDKLKKAFPLFDAWVAIKAVMKQGRVEQKEEKFRLETDNAQEKIRENFRLYFTDQLVDSTFVEDILQSIKSDASMGEKLALFEFIARVNEILKLYGETRDLALTRAEIIGAIQKTFYSSRQAEVLALFDSFCAHLSSSIPEMKEEKLDAFPTPPLSSPAQEVKEEKRHVSPTPPISPFAQEIKEEKRHVSPTPLSSPPVPEMKEPVLEDAFKKNLKRVLFGGALFTGIGIVLLFVPIPGLAQVVGLSLLTKGAILIASAIAGVAVQDTIASRKGQSFFKRLISFLKLKLSTKETPPASAASSVLTATPPLPERAPMIRVSENKDHHPALGGDTRRIFRTVSSKSQDNALLTQKAPLLLDSSIVPVTPMSMGTVSNFSPTTLVAPPEELSSTSSMSLALTDASAVVNQRPCHNH